MALKYAMFSNVNSQPNRFYVVYFCSNTSYFAKCMHNGMIVYNDAQKSNLFM